MQVISGLLPANVREQGEQAVEVITRLLSTVAESASQVSSQQPTTASQPPASDVDANAVTVATEETAEEAEEAEAKAMDEALMKPEEEQKLPVREAEAEAEHKPEAKEQKVEAVGAEEPAATAQPVVPPAATVPEAAATATVEEEEMEAEAEAEEAQEAPSSPIKEAAMPNAEEPEPQLVTPSKAAEGAIAQPAPAKETSLVGRRVVKPSSCWPELLDEVDPEEKLVWTGTIITDACRGPYPFRVHYAAQHGQPNSDETMDLEEVTRYIVPPDAA